MGRDSPLKRRREMKRYTVAQLGLGHRGTVHADAFDQLKDRFELVALCELDRHKLESAGKRYCVSALFEDAERMLAGTKPDVFCFVTQPSVRVEMVRLAAKHAVKALAFEKPMARSLEEALEITELCRRSGIKAVVSHQQKYLTSLAKVHELVEAGEIGDLIEVHGTSACSLTDLGTHYMDYLMWANGGRRVEWVIGHVHGTRELDASHPSPDHFLARMRFENGVHGLLEIGALSPRYMGQEAPRWLDNRLMVRGTHGYAWGDTDGRWGAYTRSCRGEMIGGLGPGYDPAKLGSGWQTQQSTMIQKPYLAELADWLDDDDAVHPCNVELAYHGFEVLDAACISALEHSRVDLPLSDPSRGGDIFGKMKKALQPVPEFTPGSSR
jgi:predicted dehydrogenase